MVRGRLPDPCPATAGAVSGRPAATALRVRNRLVRARWGSSCTCPAVHADTNDREGASGAGLQPRVRKRGLHAVLRSHARGRSGHRECRDRIAQRSHSRGRQAAGRDRHGTARSRGRCADRGFTAVEGGGAEGRHRVIERRPAPCAGRVAGGHEGRQGLVGRTHSRRRVIRRAREGPRCALCQPACAPGALQLRSRGAASAQMEEPAQRVAGAGSTP